jgi:uncharacterized membrane protein
VQFWQAACKKRKRLAFFAKTSIILDMETTEPQARLRLSLGKGGLVLTAALLLVGWLLNTPPGMLGKADAVGYAVCHRISERSFHIGDRQLPLCVRCTGMYLGAMLGLIYQVVLAPRRGRMLSWRAWLPLSLLVVAFGVDGLNSYAHLIPALNLPSLYEPQHWLRLLTGTGMGLVMMIALYPVFNQTVWRDWIDLPVFTGWRPWAGLFGLALALDGLAWTQNPLVLYPLAYITAGGVVIILSMTYSMVWLMLFRRENRIHLPRQLFWPLLAGFITTLAQIIALDFVRYLITGTWGGISLG